jgi:two-component system NarL family sensor kinase
MMTGKCKQQASSRSPRLAKLSKHIEKFDPSSKDAHYPMDAMLEKATAEAVAAGPMDKSRRVTNALAVSLLEAQEEERKRLSSELHDGLGQMLTHLKLETEQCLMELAASGNRQLGGDGRQRIQQLPELLTEALEEVRTICRSLRPAQLDDLGVLAAITAQCRRLMQSATGLQIEMAFSVTEPEIPDATKTTIYRIVQEALTNCIKYADADLIRVSLQKTASALLLGIEDNGKGFDVNATSGQGIGLISMRERAQSLQGGFKLESVPDRGTVIRVSIPLSTPLLC